MYKTFLFVLLIFAYCKADDGDVVNKPDDGDNVNDPDVSDGDDVSEPVDGDDVNKPDDGDDVNKPDDGVEVNKPDDGVEVNKPDDGDYVNDPDVGGDVGNLNGTVDGQLSARPTNPYYSAGKCKDHFKNHAIKRKFSIDELAGQGDYTYLYSSTVIAGCATARIDERKDKFGKTKYTGSATVYAKGLKSHTTYKYENHPTGVNGYISEVQTRGKKTYTFTLIVRDYDCIKGVLSYIRCSDQGLGKKDLRSIVVKVKYADDKEALKTVENFKTNDKNQFGTDLSKISPCPKK